MAESLPKNTFDAIAREMAQLRFPTAVLPHEFVHEQNRRTLAGFFIVQLDAVAGSDVGHGVSSPWSACSVAL